MIVTGERIHASSNLSVLLMVHQTPIVGACHFFNFFKYYIKCQFTEALTVVMSCHQVCPLFGNVEVYLQANSHRFTYVRAVWRRCPSN